PATGAAELRGLDGRPAASKSGYAHGGSSTECERCRSRHFQRPEPGQHQRKGEPASAEGGPRRCVWRLVPGCRCC
ncbi:hypothetical protein AK812_SmicGene47316, partial [Symbiodinium microadriaticum]